MASAILPRMSPIFSDLRGAITPGKSTFLTRYPFARMSSFIFTSSPNHGPVVRYSSFSWSNVLGTTLSPETKSLRSHLYIMRLFSRIESVTSLSWCSIGSMRLVICSDLSPMRSESIITIESQLERCIHANIAFALPAFC